MSSDLKSGELVVAKGRLATVQQVFSDKNIRVVIVSTDSAMIVSRRDIERIEKKSKLKR